MIDHKSFWIGRKVVKKSGKKFKSKLIANTVRDIGLHAELCRIKGYPVYCFVFEEDDSYVACDTCELAIEIKLDFEG